MPEFLTPYKAERGNNLWFVTGPEHHRSDYEFDTNCCSGNERDAKILAQQEAGILNRAYNAGRTAALEEVLREAMKTFQFTTR
jgi:hypothetical protein